MCVPTERGQNKRDDCLQLNDLMLTAAEVIVG